MSRLRIGLTIIALLALVVTASLAGKGGGGKKPPPTPPDPAIVFQVERRGHIDLEVVNEDGSNRTLILEGARGQPGDLHRSPAWSPDATQIVFRSNIEGHGVYLVDADGSNLTKLVDLANTYDGPNPAWSPVATAEGTSKIAYLDVTPGGNRDVYIMNVDGSDARVLVETPEEEFSVTWSPAADRIAVAARHDGAIVYDLGLADGELATTGSTVVNLGPLAGARSVSSVDWAKTQDKLLVVAALQPGENNDLWIIDLADTQNPFRLTNTPGEPDEGGGTWSSDDSRIAFGRGTQDWQIYVINVDGTGEDLLFRSKGRGKYFAPDWRR